MDAAPARVVKVGDDGRDESVEDESEASARGGAAGGWPLEAGLCSAKLSLSGGGEEREEEEEEDARRVAVDTSWAC